MRIIVGDARYFWRTRDRRAPHNLYTSTFLLQEAMKARGEETYHWEYDLFRFGEPPEGTKASDIKIAYPGSYAVGYHYDATTRTYLHEMGGSPHVDRISGVQLSPTTVMVLYVDYEDLGIRDMAGELSPDCRVVGSGDALVFCAGMVIPARWEREDISRPILFSLQDGSEVAIPPGQVWVHLVPKWLKVMYTERTEAG